MGERGGSRVERAEPGFSGLLVVEDLRGEVALLAILDIEAERLKVKGCVEVGKYGKVGGPWPPSASLRLGDAGMAAVCV